MGHHMTTAKASKILAALKRRDWEIMKNWVPYQGPAAEISLC